MNIEITKQYFNRLIQTELILKLGEKIHRYTYANQNRRMKQSLNRFKICQNKKPKDLIRKEIKACHDFWKCYPLHYFRYNLYKLNYNLGLEDLLSYIPEFFFYVLFLPHYDSKKYETLIIDKNITELVFSSLSIGQPKTICKIIENKFYSKNLTKIDFANIKNSILNNNYNKIFIKPALGYGGEDICVFKKNKDGIFINKFNLKFNEDFIKKKCKEKDYIIQAGVTQHEFLSKIYPESVNSLRIITENKNEMPKILHAILRMGRNGSEFDNINQNGLFTDINIENGSLGKFACADNCEKFLMHPNTKFVFKDAIIPKWNIITEFVKESAGKLPIFKYLAWDIVLTNEKPLAIEANLNYGLDGWQIVCGGLRKIYGIEDPKYYWKNKGKRI